MWYNLFCLTVGGVSNCKFGEKFHLIIIGEWPKNNGTRDDEILAKCPLPGSDQNDGAGGSKGCSKHAFSSQKNLVEDISLEEVIPGSQPISPRATPVQFGGGTRPNPKPSGTCNAVTRNLCQWIERLQSKDTDISDDVFTVPHTSTPCLGEIYKHAIDGIIPDEGLTEPSVIGCLPAEEKTVQEEIENPGKYHEEIVRDWGFNFNDSPFPKKK